MQEYLKNLGNKINYKIGLLTIKRIHEKLSEKYDQMNIQSEMNNPRENEKSLYLKIQYKGTCTTCVKSGHKLKAVGKGKV